MKIVRGLLLSIVIIAILLALFVIYQLIFVKTDLNDEIVEPSSVISIPENPDNNENKIEASFQPEQDTPALEMNNENELDQTDISIENTEPDPTAAVIENQGDLIIVIPDDQDSAGF